ncbi:MAG: RNA 3'-phosphate cyclase [Fimbriimonadaceae bacterium]|nr:RNA 3'-phosphate cyclase [Fimbriimonadaceae bacterium]
MSSDAPWVVDAGEGGGQLVRTAVCLAALQGRVLHLTGIRARRSRPGLARQHVAAVKAVARAAEGSVSGAELGSLSLQFYPGQARGPLELDINIGSAGSTMLVLQALLPLLVRRGGVVRVIGGTDNPLAPPVDFYRAVLLPALAAVGILVDLELTRRGWYPEGAGEVIARCEPLAAWPGFERVGWGEPVELGGVAYASRLPLHVCERLQAAAVRSWKKGEGLPTALRPVLRACRAAVELRPDEPAISPGAGIVLWVTDDQGQRIGAAALGEKGKPSERVAEEAAAALLADLATGAPCDRHLGDQLAIWAALAASPSSWRVAVVTDHLRSCLALLAAGLGCRYQIAGDVVTLQPAGGA